MKLRESKLRWRRTGEQIVVLDLSGNEYFELNPTGALLWERLADGPRTSEELEQVIDEAYGVGSERARADVAAFVATLNDHELLEQ